MKITIVSGAFFPIPPTMGGGVEKVWFTLAPEFVKRGHEVVMISRKLPSLAREETIDGVKHLRVNGFDTPRSLVWLKFLDLIYSIRTLSILPPADIIVTNTFWLPILLRDPRRGKIYVHVGRYPKGQMRFYHRAARLQAPSRAIADEIAREAPTLANRVAAIPYPITTSTTASPRPLRERERIILFVGRVHPEKGVLVLVNAFASGAQSAFADWKLMIVGPTDPKLGGGGNSYLASLQRAAEKAKGKINLAGPIFDSAKLADVYQRARIFVYPSLSERGESFGLAPLEAMTHGCAAIVSDLGCFRDFIDDNRTGFVFDHRSDAAEALREKLQAAIADENLLQRVADAGLRKSGEFSPGRVAELFLADFERVQAA
jgi:glycosyltransferase involved in cell wall biosynthesis